VGTNKVGDTPTFIRQARQGTAERIGQEHNMELSDTATDNQGKHLEGSARCFVEATAPADPSIVKETVYVEGETPDFDAGRMYFNPTTQKYYVYVAGTENTFKEVKVTDADNAVNAVNADILDGLHGASYGPETIFYGGNTIDANDLRSYGVYHAMDEAYQTSTFTNLPVIVSAGGFTLLVLPEGSGHCLQIFHAYMDNKIYTRFHYYAQGGLVWSPWAIMWSSGNDGSGSGLDADLLEGLHAGNGSGQIPVSNGTMNTNLVAQYAGLADNAATATTATNVQYSTEIGVQGNGEVCGVKGIAPVGGLGQNGVYGTGNTGVFGYGGPTGVRGSGTTYGVTGDGSTWDFYANGSGGNYGPFTGAHEISIIGDTPEVGMILSCTGKVEKRDGTISATIPECTLSSKEKDASVFGVFTTLFELPEDHWCEDKEKQYGIANALGDGRVLVTNKNGDIKCGDYITTSAIPGYGEKQDDDLVHSYTLGKCTETVDWDAIEEVNGYKSCLIACVYFSA
jgi:hypothetical protein